MKLSKFGFKMPEDLIAMYPEKHRDESRLMVLDRKTGKIEHKVFKDIIQFFDDGDLFVFNNTRVFPARLYGIKEKTGAQIEVFLLRELDAENKMWDVLVDPARKIRIGNKLYFGENHDLVAEVIDNTTSRGRTLRFHYQDSYESFKKKLYELGEPPIPKSIINRPADEVDEERYQTVFAKETGAVAAPTAGMHFSRELLKRFEIKGIHKEEITLHAGLGNFREINVEDLAKHKIDSEEMKVSERTAKKINSTLDNGHQVVAVGTTVLRALETPITTNNRINPFEGWTNKFIQPPYTVNVPTAMISNFHLSYSLMLINVCGFGDFEMIMNAYKVAVQEKYRFGTYGDALLIL